ncbi:MAG TPA: RNA polymerase sigma factor [Polyangiaceae bacterium]|jgi:RNA polymerase sigma-70 factor (ECF subfamily)
MQRQFERLRRLVVLAVRRVMSPRDQEYEDTVQAALAGIITALSTGHQSDERSPRWVLSVARNIAIDRLRARTRERRVFQPDDGVAEQPGSNALEPEHLTHVRDQLRRLNVGLHGLGPRRATVVYLHDVLGHELTEIASAIGISVAAAQSRLVRGRRALLEHLRRIEKS